MNREEIIQVILTYEKELIENYRNNAIAFGYADKDTEREFSKWNVIDELLVRLNLQKEKSNSYNKLDLIENVDSKLI